MIFGGDYIYIYIYVCMYVYVEVVQSIPEDIDPNSFAGQTVLGPCKALSGPEKNSEAAWATMLTRSLA